MTNAMLDQLRSNGLLAGDASPALTPKGRDWLRALEDVGTQEVVDSGEAAADLVMSTNGLFR